MSSPVHEAPHLQYPTNASQSSADGAFDRGNLGEKNHLMAHTSNGSENTQRSPLSSSRSREQSHRLEDDLEVLRAERVASDATKSVTENLGRCQSRSHLGPENDFDIGTDRSHEKASIYKPPRNPTTNLAKALARIHNSNFLVRYFSYIVPVVVLLLIPLLLGALVYEHASVGGVKLLWFSVWLEIIWLTLWGSRIVAKCLPYVFGPIASIFTNNDKKWKDLGRQLEFPATLFFWGLGIEISFLPTMTNHHVDLNEAIKPWEKITNKILIAILVGFALNLASKITIQLIAISFHLRTYEDRIETNKFHISCLVKLYNYSKEKIKMEDSEFEANDPTPPGTLTPVMRKAHRNAKGVLAKVGDVAGKVAGDLTGKTVVHSSNPNQVVLSLLNTTPGSQVLARRLFRTFIREDTETVYSDDLKKAFDNEEQADTAFQIFDKDLNGDISMEELESVCVEIGRERKSINASLKDLDSVISKLDGVFIFVVVVITILVFVSLMSASATGVLTSTGAALLALSWLFSATAQEFLQSVIFVFVKHPFDVGDRVDIYGNTGTTMKGDTYFVKEISLLYTEFKKLEGHIVQAPNSYLNNLFILNNRRSGPLAEAIPIVIKFGTSLEQIEELRKRLLEFVMSEKRDFQSKIMTELRDITEAHSITLNVVFFYKSNAQNELLRLQRRNKFICCLMVAMSDIGIEGPRTRSPGASENTPFYLQGHPTPLPPPQDYTSRPTSSGPQDPVPSYHPSTLRASGRARGETISQMSKRVDFSLGMQDLVSSDPMSDVYEDRRHRTAIPSSHLCEGDTRHTPLDNSGNSLRRSFSREGRSSMDDKESLRLRSTHSTRRHRLFSGSFTGRGRDGIEHELSEMESGMAGIPEVPSRQGTIRIDPRSSTARNTPQHPPAGGHTAVTRPDA
ncbi:hypothetical protein FGG08_000832 [Glutinoglossum americanum]|uniref:EF-hand domain-containing protein n=1 Tax=Glutinoglossum americanum TaxID=1670608 RepID=A0A9P8IEL6_9PEZI|nr:hypothetical protein FGG08_000832 [Glutinoglossum americanum]